MLPLLSVRNADAHLIARPGRRISALEFSATVQAILAEWPNGRYAINLCENRYFFLLGFVAACLREQITLLPPNRAAETLRALQSTYDECCVFDDDLIDRYVQATRSAAINLATNLSLPTWTIAGDRIVALTFTSGSTGTPSAHEKTWRLLTRNSQLAANEVLGGPNSSIVATVPAQHVYGLETSAITALVAQCTVFDGKPFFPADVCNALHSIDAPRTLVTTPTHLRVMIESGIRPPSLRRIVSATATLPVELAKRIEDEWRAPVFEIYGCTEAGIMANRRTIESAPWRTFTGGTLQIVEDVAHYSAPQLREAIPLQDILALEPQFTPGSTPGSTTEFHLHGRLADLVKVAGKRTSLQALTRELLSLDGVRDAAVFVPEADARPAALVVAPGRSAHALLNELQERVDAVFLPRPLILLESLPRNEVGKLPRDALLQILDTHRKSST